MPKYHFSRFSLLEATRLELGPVVSILHVSYVRLCENCLVSRTFLSKQFRSRKNKQTLLNRLYDKYQRDAKKNKRDFQLEFNDFQKLVLGCCYLCGCAPKAQFKRSDGRFILVNGIDRVDNKIGYILSNCKTACKACNFLKGSLKPKDFSKQIRKILTYSHRITFVVKK